MKDKEKLKRKLRGIKKVVLEALKIDLKTEAESQKASDNFWLAATPEWFRWLSGC
jgi:hypothetical protein